MNFCINLTATCFMKIYQENKKNVDSVFCKLFLINSFLLDFFLIWYIIENVHQLNRKNSQVVKTENKMHVWRQKLRIKKNLHIISYHISLHSVKCFFYLKKTFKNNDCISSGVMDFTFYFQFLHILCDRPRVTFYLLLFIIHENCVNA